MSLTTFCTADNSRAPTGEKFASEVLTTDNINQINYSSARNVTKLKQYIANMVKI